jgi:hypothetical protein
VQQEGAIIDTLAHSFASTASTQSTPHALHRAFPLALHIHNPNSSSFDLLRPSSASQHTAATLQRPSVDTSVDNAADNARSSRASKPVFSNSQCDSHSSPVSNRPVSNRVLEAGVTLVSSERTDLELRGCVLRPALAVTFQPVHRIRVHEGPLADSLLQCVYAVNAGCVDGVDSARGDGGGVRDSGTAFRSGPLTMTQTRALVPMLHNDPMVRFYLFNTPGCNAQYNQVSPGACMWKHTNCNKVSTSAVVYIRQNAHCDQKSELPVIRQGTCTRWQQVDVCSSEEAQGRTLDIKCWDGLEVFDSAVCMQHHSV